MAASHSDSHASASITETPKLSYVDAKSPNARTYEMYQEDHTLGNSLRHVIMEDPSSHFCAYSIPHPLEQKMHFRVESKESSGKSANDTLRNGLENLKMMCQETNKAFADALKSFESSSMDRS